MPSRFILAALLPVAIAAALGGCSASGGIPPSATPSQHMEVRNLPPPPSLFNWMQPGINAAHTAYNDKETTLGLGNVGSVTQAWSFATGAQIGNPIVTDGTLAYIDSGDGYLYAVNVTTGALVWKFQTYWGNAWATSPAVGKDVYVPCLVGGSNQQDGLCALNKKTGKLLWSWYDDCSCLPNSGVEEGPVVSGTTVVIGYYNQQIYRSYTMMALDATTGAVLWQVLAGNNTRGYGLVNSTPASDGTNVYAGTAAGLCSYSLSNGNVNWCSGPDDGGTAPAVAKGVVYVNTFNNGFYAYNASNGNQLWQYTPAYGEYNGYDDPPAIAKGVVYFSSINQGNLYALKASTGSLLFETSLNGQNDTGSSPSVANGVVYTACSQGLCGFNATTGAMVMAVGDGGSKLGSPAIANGMIYAVCGNNNACMYDLPARARRAPR